MFYKIRMVLRIFKTKYVRRVLEMFYDACLKCLKQLIL
jgi:hypothetical protein